MSNEMIDDEMNMMYGEGPQAKTLDSSTFQKAIKYIPFRKPVTLAPHQTVAEAIAAMQKKRIGCVLVADNGKLAGIFTERDVLLKVANKPGTENMRLSELMTPKVTGFQKDDSIAFVLNAMHVGGYRHVPIVDEQNGPLAVISVKDIISYILDQFPEDVLNLPPQPMRKTEEREGA
jgi:CBS domain-containing protein